MAYQKHAKLARPAYGQFHRQEWALVGAPCSRIQQLAGQLIHQFKGELELAFVDADHQAPALSPALKAGAGLEYTDRIAFHQFNREAGFTPFQFRSLFNEQALVLVNGNHFIGQRQIVLLDPKKKESLSRKLERLTDVQLILLTKECREIYPYLLDHLDGVLPPVLEWNDWEGIAAFIRENLVIPSLKGLVLAGGKSQRMGKDKGMIEYHGKPQREYLYEQLSNCCTSTFISCRGEQVPSLEGRYPFITDSFLGLGPMGAILSAFREDPEAAWLVVATDLPLLGEKALKFLIEGRNPSRTATAYQSPDNEFPEPLVAIWEPRAYPILLQFLAQGYSCPRKVLINSRIECFPSPRPEVLINVNKPEEMRSIQERFLDSH